MEMLRKEVLLGRILAAIEMSGWQCFIERETHPFLLRASNGTQVRNLRVYIWSLTSGGPASVRPQDEFRIQITGVSSLQSSDDFQTLLLGWHEGMGTFAAFDARRHSTFGRSPSIQIRLTTLEEAFSYGFSFQRRGNNEVAIAFTPDQFMNYIMHQRSFHRFGRSADEVEILAAAREAEPAQEELGRIPIERREVVQAVRTWTRERDFRGRVLLAYEQRCAVCHLQLRLVEAAHIIPVHVPGSDDSTPNGLALCSLHHDAYDTGLVAVAPDYHIQVNENRLQTLRCEGLDNGADAMLGYVCNTIVIPSQMADRPNPDYLQRGMELRGWPVTN